MSNSLKVAFQISLKRRIGILILSCSILGTRWIVSTFRSTHLVFILIENSLVSSWVGWRNRVVVIWRSNRTNWAFINHFLEIYILPNYLWRRVVILALRLINMVLICPQGAWRISSYLRMINFLFCNVYKYKTLAIKWNRTYPLKQESMLEMLFSTFDYFYFRWSCYCCTLQATFAWCSMLDYTMDFTRVK